MNTFAISVHPLIKVHEQIVMTTLGSTVTLICGVEASPKAVHFWNKYNGPGRDEISINSPSGRFRLSEDSESLYSYVITLTIHGVKESDLGNYTCGARNSYGTVKGAISLESKFQLWISICLWPLKGCPLQKWVPQMSWLQIRLKNLTTRKKKIENVSGSNGGENWRKSMKKILRRRIRVWPNGCIVLHQLTNIKTRTLMRDCKMAKMTTKKSPSFLLLLLRLQWWSLLNICSSF